MRRWKNRSRVTTAAFTAAVAAVLAGSVFAQSVDDVLRAEARRLQLAQAAQEQVNDVVEATRSLTDDYRGINKEIDGLRVYNRLMTAQVQGQEAVLAEIALSMDQVDVINRQIFPLMERMIDGLEQSVSLDVPFLLSERQERIATLSELMSQSNVSVAEKFRKVMEAYQIEMDYGSSVEQYTQSLELPNLGVRDYNMLRVGRIGLYFQSDDAQITGWWNADTGQFEELGNEHRNEIRKGLRMARQLIAPELLLLPLPAAEEAS